MFELQEKEPYKFNAFVNGFFVGNLIQRTPDLMLCVGLGEHPRTQKTTEIKSMVQFFKKELELKKDE